ncbi:MAG TPA: folate hydrolase, partial [Thermoanaerobaculia bacterium]
MRRTAIVLAVFLATTLLAQTPASDSPMLGFSAADAAKERALEAQFDSSLKRDDLRDWMKRLSARPHHLGSAYDHDNALFIASLFKSWGYDTNIEEFSVLFPTPKRRVVELIAPEHFTAKLVEPPVPGDATSGQQSEQLPVYNAYS